MNYIVLDTETANTLDDPFTYDIGFAIVDKDFNVLKTYSFVVADIFLGEKDLMKEAFFADKIPQYEEDIRSGARQLKSMATIRKVLKECCEDFEVKAIIAHNAPFDYRSCQKTQRYLTCSRYRYFFPYGVEIWDSLKMARQTFGKDKDYQDFCSEHDFCCSNGKPRLTAEILYRYLTNDLDFEEKHTGIDDVLIEKEIAKACLMLNPDIETKCWG